MAQMELAVLDFIQEFFRNPFMDSLMPAVTSLGDAGFLWILLGLALLCSRKYRRTGAAVLLSLAADLVICNLLLKNMVARVRPCDLNPAVQLLIARPSDFSFPSGHTAAAFTSVFPFTGKTTGCGSRSWSWRRSLRSPECTCTSISPRMSWEAWPWAGYAPWRDRLYPGVCSLRHDQEIVLAFLFPLHYNSLVIQYVLRGGVRFPTGGDSPRPAKCS